MLKIKMAAIVIVVVSGLNLYGSGDALAQECDYNLGDFVGWVDKIGGSFHGIFDVLGGYGLETSSPYFYDQIVIVRIGEKLMAGKSYQGCPVGSLVEIGRAGAVFGL